MTNEGELTLEERIPAPNASWLAQISEEILEPNLPIIDPHHHLWDMKGKQYLLNDLLSDLDSGHNIVATVFLECASMYRKSGPEHLKPIGEIEFVNGIAAMSASGKYGNTAICAGIIGFADLTMGACVEEVLNLQTLAGGSRFKGIRYGAGYDPSSHINNSHTNPPPGIYNDRSFREGFAKLKQFDLSFEAWLYHPQIDDVISLARDFPAQPIVLNHFGGPIGIGPYKNKRDQIFTEWKQSIQALSKCPNVFAKLGGLGMVLNGYQFESNSTPPSSSELAELWSPYFETTIEAFGTNRCMFESNFPVDKVTSTYAVYWNCFKRIAQNASTGEKQQLFHDTAKRFYRLQV